MLNKKCPFCRKDIAQGTEKCPHCNRVFIERVAEQSSGSAHTTYTTQGSQTHSKKTRSFRMIWNGFIKRIRRKKTQKIHYAYQYDKWKRTKKILLTSPSIITHYLSYKKQYILSKYSLDCNSQTTMIDYGKERPPAN